MKTWLTPPPIKVYEALGAVADKRIKIFNDEIRVYSSSGNKFYIVRYEPETNSIITNDNGSYWKGYLGYPAISYLLNINALEYKPELAKFFQNIAWKNINTKYKNDFTKTTSYIFDQIPTKRKGEIEKYITDLLH